jgi:predicted kinase
MHPDHLVVLVNGLPAAGKSTLAPPLAEALGLPLFSKDVIKETHADVFGASPPDDRSQRDWNRLFGRAASETLWALLAYASRGAVLESSWRADVRSFAADGLARAGASRVIEVWCSVPQDVAWKRDRDRWPTRHPIHGARMTGDEMATMEAHAEPLGFGPVIRVDTTKPADVPALADQITSEATRLTAIEHQAPAS